MEQNKFSLNKIIHLNDDSDEEWTKEDTDDLLDMVFPDGYDYGGHKVANADELMCRRRF